MTPTAMYKACSSSSNATSYTLQKHEDCFNPVWLPQLQFKGHLICFPLLATRGGGGGGGGGGATQLVTI